MYIILYVFVMIMSLTNKLAVLYCTVLHCIVFIILIVQTTGNHSQLR